MSRYSYICKTQQQIHEKLSPNGFKWVRYKSKFNKDFIKNYNKDSRDFLKSMFNIVKIK